MATTSEQELETYLASLQQIEVYIKEKKPVDAIIKRMLTNRSYYLGQDEQLIRELRAFLAELTAQTGKVGKLMSTKAILWQIKKSEARTTLQRQLREASFLSERNAQRRTALYAEQIARETAYTKSQIKEFIANSEIAGKSPQQTVQDLIRAASEDQGIGQNFKRKMEKIAIDAARREASSQAIDTYRAIALPGEEWEWVTVSGGPCPDCKLRAGKVLSMDDWVELGLPGSGRTICGSACMCQLGPVSVFSEMFPDVKEYKFDRNTAVLTTAAEARTLKDG